MVLGPFMRGMLFHGNSGPPGYMQSEKKQAFTQITCQKALRHIFSSELLALRLFIMYLDLTALFILQQSAVLGKGRP